VIRKTVIVILALTAVAGFTVGTLVGSGQSRWNWRMGADPVDAKPEDTLTVIAWDTNGRAFLRHTRCLGADAQEAGARYAGPGYSYQWAIVPLKIVSVKTVPLNEPSGKYFEARTLIVSWVVLIVLAAVSAVYPLLAFYRGPWRRRRRRKRGQCLACGYNLTGNKSGTCPECGEDT